MYPPLRLQELTDTFHGVFCGGVSVIPGIDRALAMVNKPITKVVIVVTTGGDQGELVEAFKQAGLRDNSIVVVEATEGTAQLEAAIYEKDNEADLVIFVGGNGADFLVRLRDTPGLTDFLHRVMFDSTKVKLGASLGLVMWFDWFFTCDQEGDRESNDFRPVPALKAIPGGACAHFGGAKQFALYQAARSMEPGTIILCAGEDSVITCNRGKLEVTPGTLVERILVLPDKAIVISSLDRRGPIRFSDFWDPDWH